MSDYYPAAEEVLPLFRRTDPETSRLAAARVREFSGDHCRRVLEALELGPAGQTEIAARCGLLAHQVNKRLADLRRAGLVETTGERRLSASGRQERVWRVAASA
jgi:transcription initiation factor IIE alpha subunit